MNAPLSRIALYRSAIGELATDAREALAQRHLFSMLAHLEQIAVWAAERGDGVDGQLEDELLHQRIFTEVAGLYGGMIEAPPAVRSLMERLEGYSGASGAVALNLVAERWLETVFAHMTGRHAGLFSVVEMDERRHVEGMQPTSVDEWIIRDVERGLAELAMSPSYLLPMTELFGAAAVARLGRACIRRHRAFCESVGIEADMSDLESVCRVRDEGIDRVELNAWQASRLHLWDRPAEMRCSIRIEAPESESVCEAMLVHRLSGILAREPALNRTIRGGLWAPHDAWVGVRRSHDGDMLLTVPVRGAHRRSPRAVRREIVRRLRRMRAKAYVAPPDVGELSVLLPPQNIAATVSMVGAFGVQSGTGPLIDNEGVGIALFVGAWDGGFREVGITMDHRAFDGRDAGYLCRELMA